MLLPQVAKQAKSEIFSMAGVAGFVWSPDHQSTFPFSPVADLRCVGLNQNIKKRSRMTP